MSAQNLIHVKFEYEEAVNAKKEILISQAEVLRVLKIIKKYHQLRSKELNNKLKLHKKIKLLITHINKLKATLPKIKISDIHPEETDSDEISKKSHKHKKIKEKIYDNELDRELADIQKKLQALGR